MRGNSTGVNDRVPLHVAFFQSKEAYWDAIYTYISPALFSRSL